MLEAGLTFSGAGAIGALNASSFFGNDKAIQAPTIQKTSIGQYTVTFLSGRDLKVTQPPAVNITAQDNTGSIFTAQLVQPVQFTFNPNAQDYQWSLVLQIVVQKIVPSINVLILGSYNILTAADPGLVMVSIRAALQQ